MNTVKTETPRRPRASASLVYDCYRDNRGEWRWRLWAKNGRVIADSAESYKRRADMAKMINQMRCFTSVVAVEGTVVS